MLRYAQTHLQLYQQLRGRGAGEQELASMARAYALATRLFAGQYRASGKPFLCHLVGTASILEAHGAPAQVVCAGLVHAAYEQGEFGDGRTGATGAKRAVVRGAVGEEAEVVVHAYASVHWSTWRPDRVAARLGELPPPARQAAWITPANELEEALDLALCHAAPERQETGLEALGVAALLAEAQGLAALARELEDALAGTRAARVPAALRDPHATSYTLHSLTPVQRVRVAARHRLRRLLGRS